MGISLFAKASNLLDIPMIHSVKKENPANEKIAEYEQRKGETLIRKDMYGRNIQAGCRYKF
ncbi:hypothetical protein Barb7_02677 [Bacteroidales bacterium Barb7]|nr:hypothetical protein Barb7_02677 [Bacteroidales bacterium Barb7]